MKKRYVIKKVSEYLDETYNKMFMKMKNLLDYDISYSLVRTSDINVIAKAIYCRNYLTVDTHYRTESTIKDTVLYS